MLTPTRLYFDHFELDFQNAWLLQDGQPLPLTPKAYEVLAYLCRHAGNLVTKDMLLDDVWQRRFVSEGVIKNIVQELRRALGDDPKSPRYIETVYGRGYRFLGSVREQAVPDAPEVNVSASLREPDAANIVVGRDDALARLRELLGLCLAAQPQTVFLSGEAGIGKTALMRHFSALLPDDVMCAGGQCAEQYGEVEPYMPLLECLNQLGRTHGQALTDGLRRYAPTWLAQLPWLLNDDDRNALQNQAQGLSKERMRRELGAFLDHWTYEQPHTLVLLLEDLHWSDHATLDAITYLARRPGAARWMILGSYRPVDVMMNEHPLRLAIGELRLHRLCHDIALPLLPEAAVMQYLARRFEGNALSSKVMRAISRRTEGLPLYLVHLSNELAAWREQHAQSSEEGMAAFFETLPETLKLFIEQQFSRLPAEAQVILDAAAVAGSGFSPVMLATITGSDILTTEAWCERLAGSRHILVCPSCSYYPDRRSGKRYAFIHAYYQKLAYERVPLLRRTALHLAVAEWFQAVCGARIRDLAAEVAIHFKRGRNYEEALHYFQIAVGNALRRHEPHAAAASARQALTILEQHLPATPVFVHDAIELYTILIGVMQITHGWADSSLQPIFERLLHHEQTLAENPYRVPILWGVMGYHFVRGQLQLCEQYAGRILAVDSTASRPDVLICSHVGYMGARLCVGDLASVLEHFQACQQIYHPEQRGMFPLAALHPVVAGYFFTAKAFWLRGFPDQALRCVEQGITIAQGDAQPFAIAFIQWGEIICRQLRGEIDLTEAACRELLAHTDEQGFALLFAGAAIQRGWALAHLDRIEEGVDSMVRGIGMFRATGARLTETYLLAYCVEAFLRAGLLERGAALLGEAFEFMEESGERYFEAELYRLKGETLRPVAPAEAERYFQQALAISRQQGARSLELRAAMSLARLWLAQSRHGPARELLETAYSALTEGLDTRDPLEARALLAVMEDCSLDDAVTLQSA